MSDLSIPDEIYLESKWPALEDTCDVEEVVEKAQSIWELTYDVAYSGINKVIHTSKDAIGSGIRDVFFFPLKWNLLANMQWVKDQLKIEETYCRNFWDPEKPLDPSLHFQGKIREAFSLPQDRILPIQLKNGKEIELTYRVIETKEGGAPTYNFVHVSGLYATIDNNIGSTYPYLSGYLNYHKHAETLPPARFIVISENNLNYKPASMEEAGYILVQVLKALKEEFGEIDQVVAHSLGSIFFSNAMRQVEDGQILPKHICLDRGPKSIWEISRKYFFGSGKLFHWLLNYVGWSSDIEQNIVDFCQKWKGRSTILITGVVQDHYFSGNANLCFGEKVKKIEEIRFLVFDPPLQLAHQYSHHNMSSELLNACYLKDPSDFIHTSESLPEAIIRNSLLKA